MHDSSGRKLSVGDEILTFRYGLCKITAINGDYLMAENDKGSSFGYTQGIFNVEMPEAIKVRSWQELAREAVSIQDACNLSGVVNSFAIVIREVRARLLVENRGGNDNLHVHPIVVVFADKIAHLTNTQTLGLDVVMKAYAQVHKMSENENGKDS